MKLKRNTEKSNSEIPQSAGEEFFQLPRAEYLAEEMRASGARQIGDVVANTPLRMDNRLTVPVTDNSMEGAPTGAALPPGERTHSPVVRPAGKTGDYCGGTYPRFPDFGAGGAGDSGNQIAGIRRKQNRRRE